MNNFFNNPKTKKKPLKNPFAPKPNYGGGQSLGGTKPGRVLAISLTNPGPLGVKVERRPGAEKSAIIAMVVEGSQADEAGLMRGDVVCRAGGQGQDEIPYDLFLQMAAGTQRPLVFEIRRIETKSSKSGNTTNQSAELEARRRAVIAAAEKRDKAHKQKQKPIPKSGSALPTITSTAEKRRLEQARVDRIAQQQGEEPMSQEAKQAIELAKQDEQRLAAELGYNPYETKRASAGQARNATVAMTHGAIRAGDGNESRSGTATAAPNAVAAPAEATTAATDDSVPPVSDPFHDALTTLVTTNNHDIVVVSLATIQKLIVNATTKGQASTMEENAVKFRRVRLSNAKIKASVADPNGALEVMLSVGFQLLEEDGETFLVFPYPSNGPPWLPRALETMKQYEKSS